MKKLHVALSTDDVAASVVDYSRRLGCEPTLVVDEIYALWRTDQLNLSIRRADGVLPGQLRHLGWEDDTAEAFSAEEDVNGITWERFAAHHQADEINQAWPAAKYRVEAGEGE